jgi:hypothetical protein
MNRYLSALRRVGRRQRLGFAAALVLVAAVVAAVVLLDSDPALIPVSLLLLLVLVQLAITQRRVTLSKRSLDKLHYYHRRDRRRSRESRRSSAQELQHEADRTEFLQQRILASIETERLEAAERFAALSARLDEVDRRASV